MKITIALTLLALLAGNVKCSEVVQLDEDASASFLQAMSAGAITEAKAFDGCKKSNENSHEAVDLVVSAKTTDKNTGHSGNTNKLAVRCCKGTGDSLQCKTRESNKLSCTANVDYGQAVAKCGQLGAEWTLCTVAQLETKKCCGTGCNFDQHYVWTKEAAKCSAGHYLSNAACEQCAAGKFADAGSASCTACDAGKYSSAGSASCTACGAGKSSPAGSDNANKCQNCAAGKSSSAGATCTACDSGKYAAAGAACTACDSGKFSDPGSASCEYTKHANKGCHKAKIERYDDVSGAAACAAKCKENSNCKAFIVKDNWCKIKSGCDSLTNQPHPNKDTYTKDPGCSAGHYYNNAVCVQCDAGKYADAGSATCTACDAGKSSSAGSASCTACGAGKSSPAGSDNANKCQDCDAGKSSSAGAACTACDSGKFSDPGSASCEYTKHANKGCRKKGIAKYDDVSGAAACAAKCKENSSCKAFIVKDNWCKIKTGCDQLTSPRNGKDTYTKN